MKPYCIARARTSALLVLMACCSPLHCTNYLATFMRAGQHFLGRALPTTIRAPLKSALPVIVGIYVGIVIALIAKIVTPVQQIHPAAAPVDHASEQLTAIIRMHQAYHTINEALAKLNLAHMGVCLLPQQADAESLKALNGRLQSMIAYVQCFEQEQKATLPITCKAIIPLLNSLAKQKEEAESSPFAGRFFKQVSPVHTYLWMLRDHIDAKSAALGMAC